MQSSSPQAGAKLGLQARQCRVDHRLDAFVGQRGAIVPEFEAHRQAALIGANARDGCLGFVQVEQLRRANQPRRD